MIVRIEGQVQWTAFLDPKSEKWIGLCPVLNLVVEGDTWSDMQAEANHAARLLMQELLASGDLDAFLRTHGFRADVPHDVPPSDIIFDIPAPFVIEQNPIGDGVAYR